MASASDAYAVDPRHNKRDEAGSEGEEGNNAESLPCCHNFRKNKWTVVRFSGLCLLAVIILVSAYGLKGSGKHGHKRG